MSKPLPVVSQMPWHIQQNIIEAVDLETQFSIRQCSKQLKRAVDNSKISMNALSFSWQHGSPVSKNLITVCYSQSEHRGGSLVYFYSHPDGFLRDIRFQSGQSTHIEKFVENGDYVDAAIEQFVKVLRTFSKLSMRRVVFHLRRFGTDVEDFELHRRIVEEKLNRALSSLNRKILVQNLETTSNDNADGVCQILSHFRPGTLQKITIAPDVLYSLRKYIQPLNLNEIVELEQWKQASSLVLSGFDIMIPLEKTDHFSEFRYTPSSVKLENVKHILDNMLRENGCISRTMQAELPLDYDTIVRHFSQFESIRVINARTFIICRGEFACKVGIYRQAIFFPRPR